jgi:tight adherence protein C
MANPLLLIALLVFLSALFLCGSLVSYLESRASHRKVLNRMGEATPGATGVRAADGQEERAGAKEKAVKLITALGQRVKPGNAGISPLRTTFLQAGYHSQNGPVFYYGAKALLAVLLPALLVLMKVAAAKSVPLTTLTALCVMAALIGFYLPNLWLHIRIGMRRGRMLEGFPDALDLMVVCVEAGMGIDSVIQRVGNEMKTRNSVVSEEFNYLSLELRAGKGRADALRNLATRVNLEDVSSLVTLLIQTDKFGTSVAQALRVHSSSMRTKRQQRAEEMAAKLPVKLVFPLVCFIFPALFVVIAGPAVIKIVRAFAPLM